MVPPRLWLAVSGFRKLNGINGGADGDRTRDLLTASQALSQLSYSPTPLILEQFLLMIFWLIPLATILQPFSLGKAFHLQKPS